MEQRIVEFIEGQTVATVCCVDGNNRPYCFSCFYALDKDRHILYFKSSSGTHHSALLNTNNAVAGTIQPDKLNKLAIQGIQFSGTILLPGDTALAHAKSSYYLKYPFALTMSGELYGVQLETIKMTDNTLAFGKKLKWELSAETV